jgi:hypothetical protein
MEENFEFKIDKKQDNRRILTDFTLIELSYTVGTYDVKRLCKQYKSYSGYCLDPIDEMDGSISFEDIGEVMIWGDSHYSIHTYTHNEVESRKKLLSEILVYKSKLMYIASIIPVK